MAGNMTEADLLFQQWNGHVVPRSFNAGFVTLSYVVSLIGAASTLELINRRTSPKGKFNHMLLLSSAITMGGVAIWCMHFIGNRAINLAGGQAELQIAYSSGFTALSFFVPIIVLLAAFVAIGANNVVSWWRVAVGGTLAGAAICGMHYLGNASINNYVCIYNLSNVVGSAIIAVAASIAALSVFFVYRAKWESAWWKRAVSAVVLAGAVSGMHWCASTGTRYKLVAVKTPKNDELSRNTTVIVVICLSVGACLIMAGTAIYTARILKRYAHKAEQVVLATAVFDKQGRVLVTPDGLLPSEKITESFLEKTQRDSFSKAHPLFQWMFQASRNWSSITAVLAGISNHLAHLQHEGRDAARGGIKLTDDHGDPVEHYDVILRELFCAAAAALADRMKSPLTQLGILWDDILPTGAGGQGLQPDRLDDDQGLETDLTAQKVATLDVMMPTGDTDLAEKGIPHHRYHDLGKGSLMFLVRRVDAARDVEALEAAGFRFAEIHQVSGIIGSTMQIKARNIGGKLMDMARYAEEGSTLEPGVHLSFFGVRARVGAAGFDVLVRRGARNLLPSVRLPFDRLEAWQLDFIRQFERLNPRAVIRKLENPRSAAPREVLFASQLTTGIQALRGWIDDVIFEEAVLTAKTVKVPCSPAAEGSASSTCTMISFRAVIPIHHHINSTKSSTGCCFIPLSLLKVHQLVHTNSPAHLAFSRSVHREIAPIINAVPIEKPKTGAAVRHPRTSFLESRVPNRLRRIAARPHTAHNWGPVDADGNQIPMARGRSSSPAPSNLSSSTLKLWQGGGSSGRDLSSPRKSSADSELLSSSGYGSDFKPPGTAMYQQQPSFGGIMVSQEITVQVDHDDEPPDSGRGLDGNGAAWYHRRTATSSSNNGVGPALTDSAGESRLNMGPGTGGAIEMRSFADRPIIHDGSGMNTSNVEAGGFTETATFVDELFTICMESR